MKKNIMSFLIGFFTIFISFAQETVVKGNVKDLISDVPLAEALVSFEGTTLSTATDALGSFVFSSNVPLGEQVLTVSKLGYLSARFPIVVNEGQTLDVKDMMLSSQISQLIR